MSSAQLSIIRASNTAQATADIVNPCNRAGLGIVAVLLVGAPL
jgi:hypothetical protein